ncbi:MAG: restriction endonuclease subunit S [Zavarzinella sp.]
MRLERREVLRHLPHPVAESFAGTPSDWDICSLDSLVESDSPICYGILMPGEDQPNGVPVVKVKNFDNGKIDISSLLRTTPEIDKEFRRSRLRCGDVLLSIRGSVGQVAIACEELEEANITQDTARIRLNGECDHRFVFFALQCGLLQRQIDLNTIGQAVKGINIGEVRRLALPFPPLPEQREIAAILSTWDRAIELNEKLIAAKQRRKHALMQQLLTGKVRLPGFEKSVWKNCHLSDVAKNSTRRNVTSPDQATVYSVTNSVGMIPMDEGVIGENIERYKTVSHFDFAYNPMRINVGSIAMWDGKEDVLVSPDYVVFRCGPKLDAQFLEQFRQTHYWRHFVTRAGGGSVRVRIYFNDLAAMKLNLPSLEEQKAIAAVLNAQDKELQLIERRLNALKQQKKGLMQQLLTGKARVNVDAETVKG